jgi:putative ABC transport system permease protein
MTYEKFMESRPWVQDWGNTGIRTYVLLKKDADPEAFNKKIAGYVKLKTNNGITHRTPFLKRFSEIYLHGNYENGIQTGGRISYVKLFSIIAVFILIIAAINFMNLSTAKASRRIKEVGIKKAVGAGRRILIFQYLSESLLMSIFSLLTAFLIVDLLLPQFNTIIGKQLSINFDATLISYSLAITLATGIIAGSYPAFYLSGFRPASVLKGQLNASYGERWARKGLVVFQFTLSIIFIVSVLVVYKQIAFVQSTNLGYDKDNILYFYREGNMNEKSNFETLISEFRNTPGVLGASTTSHDMTGHNSGTYGVKWEGKNPEDKTEFENITVSDGMLETLGFTLAEGRSFSTAFGADTAKIIFTEAAIEFMGMKDPIGKTVKLWGKDRQIIGIVKNFHYESLHENFKPVFFRYAPDDTYIAMVKLAGGAEKETVAKLEQLYRKLNPGFSFDYKFLDSDYNAQYIAEQRVSILSRYFAGLAVLISCLGLFGLAAFTAERRLKEIGIRKVLGASEFGIVYLLSGDFTKIVFTAIVISLPVSYFFTSSWLDSFAFKISLEWWYFVGAGALSMIIAWLTVGTQSIKAARVNPVSCLKDE